MKPPSLPLRRLALGLAGLVLSACATPPQPQPLEPPRVSRSVSVARGDSLADDSTAAPLTSDSRPWIATLQVVALERLPSARGVPLIERARLVTDSESRTLLEIDLDLLAGARCEELEGQSPRTYAAELARGRATDCGTLQGALYPGTSVSFRLAVDRFLTGFATHEFVSLRVSRGAQGALQVALVARESDLRSDDLVTREELALLEPLQGTSLALLCPVRFDPGYEAYGLVLSVSPGDGSPGQALLNAAALSDLLRPDVAPVSSFASAQSDAALAPWLEAALAPEAEPQAWAQLCAAAGASLAEHAVYTGSATLVAECLATWRGALQSAAPHNVAWRLERSAAEVLLASEEPAARALLLEACGALGADPVLLRDTLEVAPDLVGWGELLLRENTYLLRHPRARVRARAYTFLQRHGVEVPNYAPLEPTAQRRAALRAWERGS